MHATIITFAPIDTFTDYTPMVTAIKKIPNVLQVSAWAWVTNEDTKTVYEKLEPIASDKYQLFVAEFINPEVSNPVCGVWHFKSNG